MGNGKKYEILIEELRHERSTRKKLDKLASMVCMAFTNDFETFEKALKKSDERFGGFEKKVNKRFILAVLIILAGVFFSDQTSLAAILNLIGKIF